MNGVDAIRSAIEGGEGSTFNFGALTIEVVNLDGNAVAEFIDGILYIDIDAAGRGWNFAGAGSDNNDGSADLSAGVVGAVMAFTQPALNFAGADNQDQDAGPPAAENTGHAAPGQIPTAAPEDVSDASADSQTRSQGQTSVAADATGGVGNSTGPVNQPAQQPLEDSGQTRTTPVPQELPLPSGDGGDDAGVLVLLPATLTARRGDNEHNGTDQTGDTNAADPNSELSWAPPAEDDDVPATVQTPPAGATGPPQVLAVTATDARVRAQDDINATRAPPGASGARAPPAQWDYLILDGMSSVAPAETTLTSEQLENLLQTALNLWIAILGENPFGDISVVIADLDGDALARTDGLVIEIDFNAAGRGWFVDATPLSAEEFTALGDGVFVNGDGVDLLTVLLHELGHVAGFDHDSGFAVMNEALNAGTRLLPAGQAETGAAVAGAVDAAGTLDLSSETADITVTITGANAADVNVGGVVTSYTNLTGIITGSGNDTLITRASTQNTWSFDGFDGGTLLNVDFTGGLTWDNIENITGGDFRDTYIIDGPFWMTGTIDDGLGITEFVIFDVLSLAGDGLTLTKGPGSVTLDDGTIATVETLKIGATAGQIFAGNLDGRYILSDEGTVAFDNDMTADATGFVASITNFALAIHSETTGSRTWISAKGEDMTAALLGVDAVTAQVSDLDFAFNSEAGDGTAVDYSATNLTIGTVALDFATDIISISGSAAFVVDDAAIVAGGFTTTLNPVAGGDNPTGLAGELFTLGISAATIFAGTGASYDIGSGVLTIETDAQGFSATGLTADIAIFETDGVSPDVYTGLEITIGAMEVHGLPGLNALVQDLSIRVNTANTAPLMDWASFAASGLSLTSSDVTEVSGNLTLVISDTVFVDAGFSIAVETGITADLGNAGGVVSGGLLSVSITGATIFAGTGADVSGGTLNAGSGTGLLISNASLDVRVLRSTTARYVGVHGTFDSIAVQNVDGLTLSVTDAIFAFNNASSGERADWTTLSNPARRIAVTADQVLSVTAAAEIIIGSEVILTGRMSLGVTSGVGGTDALSNPVTGELLSLTLQDVSFFAGSGGAIISGGVLAGEIVAATINTSGATGVVAYGANLTLGILSTDGGARYTGLHITVAGAGLVGPTDFAIGFTEFRLKLNNVSAAPDKLDWDAGLTGAPAGFALDVDAGLNIEVGGTITLVVDSSIHLVASFALQSLSGQPIDDGVGFTGVTALAQTDILIFTLTGVELFAGTGAGLSAGTLDYSNASGFHLINGNFALGIVSETTGSLRSWVGVIGSADEIFAEGLPDDFAFSLSDLQVSWNGAAADDTRLNWATIDQVNSTALYGVDGLAQSTLLEVSGNMTLNLGGFVLLSGGFDVGFRTVASVEVATGDILTDAGLMTISFSSVELFVGSGGSFNGDLTINTGSGFGIYLSAASLTLASLRADPVAAETRVWTGVQATIGAAGLTGLEGITFAISSAAILFNGAGGFASDGTTAAQRIDWSVLSAEVPELQDLDANTVFIVSGSVAVNIFDFVFGNVDFAMAQSVVDADLGGEILTGATLTEIALYNGSLFVGAGGVGVALSGVELSLAILAADTVANPLDARSWIGARAAIAAASLTGIPDVTLDLALLSLDLNQATGANGLVAAAALNWGTAIDYDRNGTYGDAVDPGRNLPVPVPLAITHSASLLRIAGNITNLDLAGLIVVSAGGFEFVKREVDVDVDGNGSFDTGVGAVDMENAVLTTIGLQVSSAFIGAGGVGFSFSDINIALATISANPVAAAAGDDRSFSAIKASLGAGTATGLPAGFELGLYEAFLEQNAAGGTTPAAALNWTTQVGPRTGTTDIFTAGVIAVSPPLGTMVTIDLDGDRALSVGGTLKLLVAPVVYVEATFVLNIYQGLDIADGVIGADGVISLTNASLMTLDLQIETLFAGIGAPATLNDAFDPGQATGFLLSGGSLSLAILAEDPTAATPRSWMGVSGGAAFVGLVGLPSSFGLGVQDLSFMFNAPDAVNGDRIEWDSLNRPDVAALFTTDGDAANTDWSTLDYAVAGRLTVAAGFVFVAGDFALRAQSGLSIDDGVAGPLAALNNAGLMTLSLSDVDIFAGTGASLVAGNVVIGAGASGFALSGGGPRSGDRFRRPGRHHAPQLDGRHRWRGDRCDPRPAG